MYYYYPIVWTRLQMRKQRAGIIFPGWPSSETAVPDGDPSSPASESLAVFCFYKNGITPNAMFCTFPLSLVNTSPVYMQVSLVHFLHLCCVPLRTPSFRVTQPSAPTVQPPPPFPAPLPNSLPNGIPHWSLPEAHSSPLHAFLRLLSVPPHL